MSLAARRGFRRCCGVRVEPRHVIHNMDGTIVYRNTYGSDPFPPRN